MCDQCVAWVPERSKGADLRSAGCNVRVGSNPTSGMHSSYTFFNFDFLFFFNFFARSVWVHVKRKRHNKSRPSSSLHGLTGQGAPLLRARLRVRVPLEVKSQWPNGQGVGFRSQRLWVRVPSGMNVTLVFDIRQGLLRMVGRWLCWERGAQGH